MSTLSAPMEWFSAQCLASMMMTTWATTISMAARWSGLPKAWTRLEWEPVALLQKPDKIISKKWAQTVASPRASNSTIKCPWGTKLLHQHLWIMQPAKVTCRSNWSNARCLKIAAFYCSLRFSMECNRRRPKTTAKILQRLEKSTQQKNHLK